MQIISDKEYIFRIIDNWLPKLNNDENKHFDITNEDLTDASPKMKYGWQIIKICGW